MKLSKKLFYSVFAWCLYDWGISAFPVIVTTFVFATYFAKSIAPDPIVGTKQWGDAIALAGVVIAFLSPSFGALADGSGRRKYWLAFFTCVLIISTCLLWFAYPQVGSTTLILSCVVVGTIALNVSMVFYNAMLTDLVPSTRVGRISGLGWGVGYFGGLLVLIIAYYGFVNKPPSFLKASSMAEVRICGPFVALWTAIFACPLFVAMKEPVMPRMGMRRAFREGKNRFLLALKTLRSHSSIARFLIAQMVYIDGLNTLFVFGGIYAAGTFRMSISEVLLFGVALNAFAGLGSLLLAFVDDYIGAKKTIFISLIGLLCFGLGIVLVDDKTTFWMLSCLLSLFVGSVQSSSRSLMTQIVPKSQANALFGFYVLSGKMSTFVGPWVFGLVTVFFHSQRMGMASILVFFIVGALILWTVPYENKPQD